MCDSVWCRVVDTAMVWIVTAGHAAVGCVDDGIAFQGGDVALPKVDPRLKGRQIGKIGHAPLGKAGAQIIVLNLQKIRTAGLRVPDVQQCPEQLPLALGVLRDAQLPVARVFFQKRPDQKQPPFSLVHGTHLLLYIRIPQPRRFVKYALLGDSVTGR